MHTIGRLGVMALAIVGLAASSDYAPTDATQWNDRYRSVVIAIPPDGSIELASFGAVELTVEGGQTVDAVHVRMVVDNGGDIAPWTVDLPDTTLAIAGAPRVTAVALNSDLRTLPAMVVDSGERRSIDLYFPRSVAGGAFELAWRVTTPTREIHERTRFAPDVTTAQAMPVALPVGWGARWWFDPHYTWDTYFHRAGIVVPRVPQWAEVTRQPARHEQREPNPCDQW